MNRTRATVVAAAALALLTACGGSGSGTTPTSTAPAGGTGSTTPSGGSTTTGAPGSLAGLQLCATTLGYAAGAIAAEPADQLATFEKAIVSAQSKAGAAEAPLVAQSNAVIAAVKSGDQAAITSAGKTMGELCGAG